MYLTSYLCNYFQLVALLFNQLCIQTELIARPAGTWRSESFSRCVYLFILPVGPEEKNSQRLSRLEPTSHEKESNRRGFNKYNLVTDLEGQSVRELKMRRVTECRRRRQRPETEAFVSAGVRSHFSQMRAINWWKHTVWPWRHRLIRGIIRGDRASFAWRRRERERKKQPTPDHPGGRRALRAPLVSKR